MTSGIRSYHLLLGVCLFFTVGIEAATKTNNATSEERVGWREGPNTRGTLNLVWSCGVTIFACTWTVMHLNVPSTEDTTMQRFLRRVKWMAINIVFPEFILSKAICDLRQALNELRQFDENLPKVTHQLTNIIRHEGGLQRDEEPKVYQRSWKVEYPPYYKILYRFLRLEMPGSQATTTSSHDGTDDLIPSKVHQICQTLGCNRKHSLSSNPNDTTQRIPFDNPKTPASEEVSAENSHQESSLSRNKTTGSFAGVEYPREWTVVHSYYAQMGGILTSEETSSPHGRFQPLTATYLTSRYEWDAGSEHPLKHLELSQEDIQDKSKADFFLKGFAVLQITWLVLNVAVRAVTRLHVTQLEIATVAFAVMATLTYLASWWKPKDISTATKIHHYCHWRWNKKSETFPIVQISDWFRKPVYTVKKGCDFNLHEARRVPNDLTWMGDEGSAMVLLLSTSSLFFGGLHCIAWNFEFPSQAELIAWRTGCAIIALLPGIALAASTLSIRLETKRYDKRCEKILTEEFNKLPTMSHDWWKRLLDPCFMDLDRQVLLRYIVSINAGIKTWIQLFSETPPQRQGAFCHGSQLCNSFDYFTFHRHYRDFRRQWTKFLKNGNLKPDEMESWRHAFTVIARCWKDLGPSFPELWRRFEMFVSESCNDRTLDTQDSIYFNKLLDAFDVYSATPWVNFVPKLS
ncbi:hypothetical protein CcaCcLH18_08835 [Colletotrichum camelliae]|nr:hypothetical protein CcaCcLH18_08835 [Colletotrichum camelliae]